MVLVWVTWIQRNQTKLMEPFLSTNFYGPQHDDILGAQTLYGDDYESNDAAITGNFIGYRCQRNIAP
jgi:hypothetical protein